MGMSRIPFPWILLNDQQQKTWSFLIYMNQLLVYAYSEGENKRKARSISSKTRKDFQLVLILISTSS